MLHRSIFLGQQKQTAHKHIQYCFLVLFPFVYFKYLQTYYLAILKFEILGLRKEFWPHCFTFFTLNFLCSQGHFGGGARPAELGVPIPCETHSTKSCKPVIIPVICICFIHGYG